MVHLGRIKMYRAVSALQPTCEKENPCKILTSSCQNCLEISASLSSHIHKTKLYLLTSISPSLFISLLQPLSPSLHSSLYLSLSLSLPLSYPLSLSLSLSSSISPPLLYHFLKRKRSDRAKKELTLLLDPPLGLGVYPQIFTTR